MLSRRLAITFAQVALLAAYSLAQDSKPHPKKDAVVREYATIDGKKILIEYSRPAPNGRKSFSDISPYGKVWETGGATLNTETQLKFDGCMLPPGRYRLFTLPEKPKSWKLIVSKNSAKYDEKDEVCRANMEAGSSGKKEPWDQFQIVIIRVPSSPSTWESASCGRPSLMQR